MAWITRFVVMLSFLSVGLLLSPEAVTLKLKDAGGLSGHVESSGWSLTALRAAHLLCFATAFGSSLWVTFIGGIIMFKNLPRHQFGNLQSKMFPVFFSMVGICAAICTAAFATLHPWSSASGLERLQLASLLCTLLFVLLNLFCFQPLTIKMMRERHKIEKDNDIGNEVGRSKNLEVAKRNPVLAKMNRKFGMVHGLSSLSNLLAFGGLAIHSWYLAGRLLL